MSIVDYILGAVLLLFAIGTIFVVIMQEGHQQGLGVVTGGADTFLSKNKARSADALFARLTKFIALGFAALVIAINVVAYFS